ncbi:DNA polymerase III subunit beta [Candidatus Saccharibacteria bacterium]|nr:DNA polymerase III subunit beta [Candidatus Saccharibacteria bacterium]
MEIEVTQEKLSKALNIVSRVAMGAKSTLPILSNVLIRAVSKKVSLTTTNLDMAVVDFIPVISAKDGEVTVPARLLAEFVSNLPHGEKIKIKANGTKVEISAGKYVSKINGASSEDFPVLPEIDEKKTVVYKMGVDEFKTGISEVIIAASGDTTRPAFTGVFFNTFEGKLYVVASDGYRIAEREFISKVESDVQAIVPTAALQEVLRSASDEVDEIELIFEENQVRFRLGEIEVTSKLIDGVFPDYRQVIPKEMGIKMVLPREELTRITKMAAVFARESSRAISCEADAKAGKFYVSSVANEMGENKSEIDTKISGSGEIKLDSRFLMDVMNVMEENEVRVEFSDEPGVDGKPQPMVIRNGKSDKYIHVIMPLDF